MSDTMSGLMSLWIIVAVCLGAIVLAHRAASALGPHYTSTACHHGLHARCRRFCKFCQQRCLCPCHKEDIPL